MESLYILMPVALVFCIVAVACWFWAVSSGQYDDLDKESRRILFDEDEDLQPAPEKKQTEAADISSTSNNRSDAPPELSQTANSSAKDKL